MSFSKQREIFRAARNILVCALAYACVAIPLHRVLPWPEMEQISGKLEYFSRHKDEFDTLFFGSSRIFRGVDSKLFDATAAAHGLPTRTFNFGIDGMKVPESYFLIDTALALKPTRLKWVFIEATRFNPRVEENVRGAARVVYWHDWTRTKWNILEPILNPPPKKRAFLPVPVRGFLRGYKEIAAQIALFLKNYSNLGRALRWMELHGKNPEERIARGEREYGEPAFGSAGATDRNTMSARDLDRYRERLKKMKNPEPDADPVFRIASEYEMAAIRAAGARPVFVVAPTTTPTRDFFPGWKNPPPVFVFNDPQRYPQFYSLDNRADIEHLQTHTAKEFTRLLAEQFARRFSSP